MNKARRARLNELQDQLQQTGLTDAFAALENIKDELEKIRDEEEEAYDNLPESLKTDDAAYPLTEINEALDKISGVFDAFDPDELDEAFAAIENAKGQAG